MNTLKQAIECLDNAHKELARSTLSANDYQRISPDIIRVKRFLGELKMEAKEGK